MRKSFNGLHMLIFDKFETNELPGKMFIFTNRRKDKLKVLYWDQDGFAIWYKRLEKGVFVFPDSEAQYMDLSSETLAQIFSGFDVYSIKKQKRFEL
jgi:transposase